MKFWGQTVKRKEKLPTSPPVKNFSILSFRKPSRSYYEQTLRLRQKFCERTLLKYLPTAYVSSWMLILLFFCSVIFIIAKSVTDGESLCVRLTFSLDNINLTLRLFKLVAIPNIWLYEIKSENNVQINFIRPFGIIQMKRW